MPDPRQAAARPGVGVGLPAAATVGGVQRLDHRRTRRRRRSRRRQRRGECSKPAIRPPTTCPRRLRRRQPAPGRRVVVVRVEGPGQLLRRGERAPRSRPERRGRIATPTPGFTAIAGAVAVMAALVDRCTVNGEEVAAAAGRLLRRVGDQLDRRTVQGRSRIDGLVTSSSRCHSCRGFRSRHVAIC